MSRESCPLCGYPMKVYQDMLDSHILLEEAMSCPTGHYHYQYEHGYVEIYVDTQVWAYTYNTPLGQVSEFHKQIEQAIKIRRGMRDQKKICELKFALYQELGKHYGTEHFTQDDFDLYNVLKYDGELLDMLEVMEAQNAKKVE